MRTCLSGDGQRPEMDLWGEPGQWYLFENVAVEVTRLGETLVEGLEEKRELG